jgi:hypothetical protein
MSCLQRTVVGSEKARINISLSSALPVNIPQRIGKQAVNIHNRLCAAGV